MNNIDDHVLHLLAATAIGDVDILKTAVSPFCRVAH
jgi:hypothetical protein